MNTEERIAQLEAEVEKLREAAQPAAKRSRLGLYVILLLALICVVAFVGMPILASMVSETFGVLSTELEPAVKTP